MSSTYLRLAAPLQSWAAARVTGNVVRTQSAPTLSGLRGLIAAACGWKRGRWEPWIDDVEFTVRVDRPGTVVDDFQTINPRDEDLEFQQRLYLLMTRKKLGKAATFVPDAQHMTTIVRRTYLADAEFLVEVAAGEHNREVAEALAAPVFTPYLGRKAFAPTFPFFLGQGRGGLLSSLPTTQSADPRARSRAATDDGGGSRRRLKLIDVSSPREAPTFVEVDQLDRERWKKSLADDGVALGR